MGYLFKMLADRLNLRFIHRTIPGEFQSDISFEAYPKSQGHLIETTRFRGVTAFFDLSIVLLLWFMEGFPMVDVRVRRIQAIRSMGRRLS